MHRPPTWALLLDEPHMHPHYAPLVARIGAGPQATVRYCFGITSLTRGPPRAMGSWLSLGATVARSHYIAVNDVRPFHPVA